VRKRTDSPGSGSLTSAALTALSTLLVTAFAAVVGGLALAFAAIAAALAWPAFRRGPKPDAARVVSSFITSARSGRALSAGSAPNSTPVTTEASSVKPSTVASMPTSLARVVKRAVNATSRSSPAASSTSPRRSRCRT